MRRGEPRIFHSWGSRGRPRRSLKNHPRQSPTICLSYTSFPVFSNPTVTVEVVGNTGKLSSEKAGVGGHARVRGGEERCVDVGRERELPGRTAVKSCCRH